MVNILLVTDSPDEHGVLAQFLISGGHHVVAAASRAELRWVLTQHRSALAIVDLGMPDGDGVELIRRIKRAKPRLPILAISGDAGELPSAVHLLIAEVYGADATIAKPIGRIELLRAVAQLALPAAI